jgi:ATP-dependent helicase/nuclease subunit A
VLSGADMAGTHSHRERVNCFVTELTPSQLDSNLTPSQQKALSQERHLAVTANAGSGKTRVMVERYVRLFERHPDLGVQNIVAITFTENAGAELRKRILERVTELMADLPRNSQRRFRLARLRDTLPGAIIGTIHSFAARMLKAYPVEANVDASFGILQGADERLMRDDVIERVFFSTLEEAYANNEHPQILQLFRILGRTEVRNIVRTLMSKRSLAAKLREELLSKFDDEILALWRAELDPLLRYPLLARGVLADIEGNLTKRKEADDVRPLFAPYFAAKTPYDSAATFAQLAALLISDTGLHSFRVSKKSLAPDLENERREFIQFCRDNEALLRSLAPSEAEWESEHRQYLSILRAAVDLAERVMIEYESDKAAYGVLDFDDLVHRFERLLLEPRVCDELSRQFRFIMIDEYQDTDATQFELAKKLTKNLTASNLMVVGDPKQSIYGFRNADVSVFRETEEVILSQTFGSDAEHESIELVLTESEKHGSLSLAESFRMAPIPLAAINRVFRSVMVRNDGALVRDCEVEYSELVHGRAGDGLGGVEWICPSKADEAGDEDIGEYELIAQKIKSIVRGADPRYHIEDKEGVRAPRYRAPRYDDIAILLRSRTPLPLIERELRALSIPFVVAKGAGFFLQQEILDSISYLSFLIAPHDDLSLVATLRSPFFALSDVDLYQISAHSSERPLSFWERLQQYAAFSNREILTRAVKQLSANLAIAGRTSASFLLGKIFEETAIYATLSARADGRQKIANLEKLLGMARASDASGFQGLFDFVERARYLIDEDEKESQADSVKTRDAVQIMTIHAAKGLEFPIVILPQLQRNFTYDKSGMLEPELGMHIRIPEADRQPFIAEHLRERSQSRTVAEEKRILYVAMTRAKDHLILCSTLPKKQPSTNWLAWISAAFPEVFEPEVSEIVVNEGILHYDGATRTTLEERLTFALPFIRSASVILDSTDGAETIALPSFEPRYLGLVSSSLKGARYSATQLLRYKECPTKYFLSYNLGIPEEPKLALDVDEVSNEKISGSLLGQVVHLLFAKLEVIAPKGALDEAAFDREIRSIFFVLEVWEGRDELSQIAKQHVQRFLRSPVAMEVLNAKEHFAEYSLQTQSADANILFGIIDRLYRTPDGIWNILDYKTERSTEHTSEARYEFQMRFYAYLVNRLFPDQQEIRAKLFYTHTGDVTDYVFQAKDFAEFEQIASSIIEKINRDANVSELMLLERNLDHCRDCRFADEAGKCVVLKANAHSGQVAEFA